MVKKQFKLFFEVNLIYGLQIPLKNTLFTAYGQSMIPMRLKITFEMNIQITLIQKIYE